MNINLTYQDFIDLCIKKGMVNLIQFSDMYQATDKGYYLFITDGGVVYSCRVLEQEDIEDFEEKYKDNTNQPTTQKAPDTTPYVRVTEKTVGKMMQLKGFEFTADANETTIVDMKWDVDLEFTGARAKTYNETGESFSHFGDTADMVIIDKDNILGYGNDFIITEFGKDIPGKMLEWGCIAETTTAATLMKGLYLRIIYTNTGNDNIVVVGALRYYI